MKKRFFLIVLALQFSLFCFSQTDSIHHYTESEIKKFSNYIRDLENKNTAKTVSEYSIIAKKQIDQLLDDHDQTYTDLDIIKLAEYIKTLEKANDIAGAYMEKNVINK